MSIMFGDSQFYGTSLMDELEEFSHIVHKIFSSSSVLMNMPVRLAKLFNLKAWRDFKKDVDQVLDKAYYIMDLYMANYAGFDDGLYGKLRNEEFTDAAIKCLFVDLIIAAGDTVSNQHKRLQTAKKI